MDRVTEALLQALRRALAEGGEHRLYRAGKLDGLFAGRGGAAGAAAARALAEGLLEVVRKEERGKAVVEWARATPAGVELLHRSESPLCALRELREALRGSQEALPLWLEQMRAGLRALDERLAADAERWSRRLGALEQRVAAALTRLEQERPAVPAEVAETHPWSADAVGYLDRRKQGGATGDCPLPELFAALAPRHAGLSVGAFHDGLRRLHDRRVLRLRPAEGAEALSRPELALFDGGAVLYYAAR
jgi:hypothetical protein